MTDTGTRKAEPAGAPPNGYQGKARKESLWRRTTESVSDALYDSAWHDMQRNFAATLVVWVFTVVSLVGLGKALLWILSI